MLAASYVYVQTDSTISLEGSAEGLFWLNVWFWLLVFQMTYGKFISDAVPMTQWERVLYNNLLAVPWTVAMFFVFGESEKLAKTELSVPAMTWVGLSLLIGVGISYSGWALRSLVSATTYSLVGVLNKMATIAFRKNQT